MSTQPNSRAELPTEQRNPTSADLDRLTVAQAVDLIQRTDVSIHRALHAARESIVAAVELVGARLSAGGRLIYVGAGTSGRLATLDAAECPPTFQSEPGAVQAILAGGDAALTRAIEGAEDDPRAAAIELDRRELAARDVVLGITAGGTTPFVHGAIDHARARGAATIFLACVPFEQAPDRADVSIRVVTGPEVLTGSTRMKAGTATKLVLNTISTLAMVRLGKVHGNLMVDVNTRGNAKLQDRGARIVAEACSIDLERAHGLLRAAGGQAKVAIAMHALQLDAREARERLARADGSLRTLLEHR